MVLTNWLGEMAANTLENVANYLLTNPDKLAHLIFWMEVKDWGKELIKRLLCRGVDPENVKERNRQLNPEPIKPPPPEDRCVCTGTGLEWVICMIGRSYANNHKWK